MNKPKTGTTKSSLYSIYSTVVSSPVIPFTVLWSLLLSYRREPKIPEWIPVIRGGVEENRLKRCLKGGGGIGHSGGGVDLSQCSVGLDIQSGIREFWTWFEQGSKDHTEDMFETDTRERNVGTDTVTEDETIMEAGELERNADAVRVSQTESMGGGAARETNTVTGVVTGNSDNTSKEKVSGEKAREEGRTR